MELYMLEDGRGASFADFWIIVDPVQMRIFPGRSISEHTLLALEIIFEWN
jgi:hypothetical protein